MSFSFVSATVYIAPLLLHIRIVEQLKNQLFFLPFCVNSTALEQRIFFRLHFTTWPAGLPACQPAILFGRHADFRLRFI